MQSIPITLLGSRDEREIKISSSVILIESTEEPVDGMSSNLGKM